MKNWKENLELRFDELYSFYYSQFFKIKMEIAFLDSSELTTAQESLVNEIIDQEKEWGLKIIEALLIYYNKTYSDFKRGWEMGGADEKLIEKVLPKEIDTEKLLQLVEPSQLCIRPEENHDKGSFGLALGCDWDEEHGIGVVFKNWKVIDVGGMDVAYI